MKVSLKLVIGFLTGFLLFFGVLTIPIAGSVIGIPFALLPLILVVFFKRRNLKVTPNEAIFSALLVPAMLGLLGNGSTSIARATASMLPWIVGLLALSLSRVIGAHRSLNVGIDISSVVIALWVVYLFVIAVDAFGLQLYAIKLSIVTPLGGSNYLASFLVFAFLRASYRNKWIALVCLVGVAFTLSRTSLVLALVLLNVRLLFSRPTRSFGIAMLFFLAVTASLLADNLISFIGTIEGYAIAGSIDTRVDLWRVAFNQFVNSPFVGAGPGGLREIFQRQIEGQDQWDPHNSILTILSNFGLIGFVIYLLYVIFGLKAIYRYSRVDETARGEFWGVCAMLLISLFEPIVFSVAFELVFGIVVGKSIQRPILSRYRSSTGLSDQSADASKGILDAMNGVGL
jgi:O-antigen ligase